MLLRDLIKELDIKGFNGSGEENVCGIAYDSRYVKPGDLFVCLRGLHTDGHDYVQSAIESGAVAILASKPVQSNIPVVYTGDTRTALAHVSNVFYGYPSRKLKLVGVTGTNGKTTVTYLLKTILEHAGKKVGLIGTNQNIVGDKVLPSSFTTPESPELQKLLAEMVDHGAEYVVMEVSSHALEQSRVAGCIFEAAVFTNLTHDHLDYHNDMESYFLAKRKLFGMCRHAVVNTDDAYGQRLMAEISCPYVDYAIENGAHLRADEIKMSARGVSFTAVRGRESWPVRLGIPGRFSVYNALAAMLTALQLGLTPEDAQKGLVIAQGVKGRAEIVNINTNYTVIIDYAHTPDGLKNIISTVKEFARGRVMVLFGCGGDRDRSKRAPMGEAAGSLADFCIVTSDNPRTEVPGAIIEEILPGVQRSGCEYVTIENRREAIKYALEHAKEGDVVILAGKGHETYQIIGTEKHDFDEREIVRELINRQS